MAQKSRRSPTRILLAAKYFSEGYGGTPESIRLLARHMASIGVICDIVSSTGYIRDLHRLAALPNIREAKSNMLGFDMGEYSGLFIAGPWNFQALVLAQKARRAKIPISYAAKGGFGRADFSRLRDMKKIPYFLGIEIFILSWAQVIIFSSVAERDNCIVPKALWAHKQLIVPEPFSPQPLSQHLETKNRVPVLGFMAEIRSLKGLRELVEAVAILREEGKEIRLRIAGVSRPGSERYLADIRAFVDRTGLSRELEWVGEIRSDQGRSAFYESLDIFICPSKSESFGLTPLEALWHGIPVAMGPNIGVRSYIPADAPVAVFAKITPEEIALTLNELISEREPLRSAAAEWRGRALPGLAGESLAVSYLRALTSMKVHSQTCSA